MGEDAAEGDADWFSYEDGTPVRTVRSTSLESFGEIARTLGATAMHDAAPAVVRERYEDHGVIGRGGMGLVRRVTDRVILREAALKELDGTLAANETSVRRFLDEAQITGQLDHPNIAPVYDIGVSADGQPQFFTMKLVEGRTLAAILKERKSTPRGRDLENLLRIFLKVCDAVAFAHSRGVIHRDLKPDNVMVGTYGQVYVMDWGIALLTGERTSPSSIRLSRPPPAPDDPDPASIAGTPAYMAPEQAWGFVDQIDERTDVFGLGGILYAILTGEPPLKAPSFLAALARARVADVTPPDQTDGGRGLAPGLCHIAMRALAAKPGDRPSTVADLKDAVEEFLRGGGWFATAKFGAGAVIVREGDVARAAYILREGRCRVHKRVDGVDVPLRELGPGDVFGETAIVIARPRTASVIALDEVTVTVVTRESLERELDRSEWLRAIVTALAERFRDLDEQLHAPRGERPA